MSNSESRTVTINGKEYYVKSEEKSSKIVAKVYEDGDTTNVKTPMVKLTESKRKWAGLFKTDEYDSLPQVMQNALTKAVESVEEERLQSEEIDSRIENVKETYQDE